MKTKLQVLIFALIISVSTFGEESVSFKPATIHFNRLENDTLDNLIARIGKDSLIKELDKRIVNATELMKSDNSKIKNDIPYIELQAINKHFKLEIDSFLNNPRKTEFNSSFYSLYNIRFGNKDTLESLQYIKSATESSMKKSFYENMYNNGGRIGFAFYCSYIPFISKSYLDTLYQGALLYSSEIRNEFYFAILEFDKSCGTEANKAAYYRHQLYEKTYPLFNLNKTLSDTTGLNAINAIKMSLIEKYKFLAYSLYANDFDIKAKQKDVIYFLSSQTNSGGFREYNIESFGSNAEATVYGLWSLLELRKQIKEIY